jgi:hypothetical protein
MTTIKSIAEVSTLEIEHNSLTTHLVVTDAEATGSGVFDTAELLAALNAEPKGQGFKAGGIFATIEALKKTGGAVEVNGVRIETCDEHGRTETTRRAEAAEAKLARVDAEAVRMDAASREARQAGLGKAEDVWAVCNARANVLTEAVGSIRAALADPEPEFALPTEAGAGIYATYDHEREFRLFGPGYWIDNYGSKWTSKELLSDCAGHRLIEAAG